MLYGYGRQGTYNDNSAYTVPLNGSVLPPLLRRREQRECGRQRAPALAAYPGLGRHPVFGRRFLDEENTAPVGGYVALAATAGYRIDRFLVSLEGTNLTNQRPPVSASEFGSQSFYLLNARMLWLRLGYAL